MMRDTAVCEVCGVDVRDESSFCYNCGKRVPTRSDNVPHSAITELTVEEPTVAGVGTEPPASKPPLRSAASLRKQRRAFNRQPVEVRWERPAGRGIGFILTAIVLTVAAFMLLVIALYLR